MGWAVLCISLTGRSQGFKLITPIAASAIVKNTGEKPQSKVWHHDGKWWAVFSRADGTYLGRLDGTKWNLNLKISSSTSVEADCKVVGDVCHILMWRKSNNPSQLVSIEYDRGSKSYSFWSLRRNLTYISLDSGAETGTIDIDGTGRMWLASDGIDDMRVRWSDPPYGAWNGPVIIASGVTDDDICAIVALPVQGQVGVLWSNQNSGRFGFKTHADGTDPMAWSMDEVPASASALDVGGGMADDHLNLATASDGTLYCSVKTSYDTPGFPVLALLKRFPDGTWDRLYEVSQSGTRGIVILNEIAGKLKVIYTSAEDGGPILYRESMTSEISFGEPRTLIEGVYNNPTSSKANYERDVLILASTETTLVGVLGHDEPSITVGIDEQRQSLSNTKCYPNPVEDVLYLEFADTGAEILISLSDVCGRIYLRALKPAGIKSMEIDTSNLSLGPGLHFLTVKSARGSQVLKFIKQ